MAENLKILLHILAVVGLNISGYRLGTCYKCFSFAVIAVLALSTLHILLSNLVTIGMEPIIGFVRVLTSSTLVLTWLSIFRQRKKFSYFNKQLNLYRKRYHVENAFNSYSFNVIAICMLAPIVLMIAKNRYDVMLADSANLYLFGQRTNNSTLNRIIVGSGFVVSLAKAYLVLLLTISLSLLICRWSEVLKAYNKILMSLHYPSKHVVVTFHLSEQVVKKIEDILSEYFAIVNILNEFNQVLSRTSFLIIAIAFQSMFWSLFACSNSFICLINGYIHTGSTAFQFY